MSNCRVCGTPISPARLRRRAVLCSKRCSREEASLKYRAANPGGWADGVPTGTIGAISELLVSADLLSKGAAVFRAVSPACSCDLAVLFGSRLLRVEVKTGHVMPSGNLVHGSPGDHGHRFDVLAVVVRATGEVRYFPPFETLAPVVRQSTQEATVD